MGPVFTKGKVFLGIYYGALPRLSAGDGRYAPPCPTGYAGYASSPAPPARQDAAPLCRPSASYPPASRSAVPVNAGYARR